MLAGIKEQHKLADAVFVAVTDLRTPPFEPDLLASFLSPDEQDRAARFRFPYLRARFRIGRGMLRHLVSQASGVPPAQLQFTYSDKGKPSLQTFPELQFNVSHSGDFWACAIGTGPPLGLDIEQIRPMPDCNAIAQRFFAPSECSALNCFDEQQKPAAFFRCWTRKEAYIKAIGDGLSRDLGSFTVSCVDEESSLVRDLATGEQWQVRSFEPAPGYAGALVTRCIARIVYEPR